ncbi:hypothetical protein [Marinomonas transparens]|uniref:Uncharacterized protein n=1 Tax=Marinomonas transparens TaxID=2795388 RepID=A0A934JMZ3_9GAMM|nr:hypothetical protein [Marinomonas transparens]MBJ7536969.1 hypothetical protein [Marinomonas transparens]
METEKSPAQIKRRKAQDEKRATQPRLPSARISQDEADLLERVKTLSGLSYKDMILIAVADLEKKLNE